MTTPATPSIEGRPQRARGASPAVFFLATLLLAAVLGFWPQYFSVVNAILFRVFTFFVFEGSPLLAGYLPLVVIDVTLVGLIVRDRRQRGDSPVYPAMLTVFAVLQLSTFAVAPLDA